MFIQDVHPELSIATGPDWFSHNHHPIIMPRTPVKWTFLNQTWDITVYGVLGPTMPEWFLLRKREEIDPVFAAYKNSKITIHEIPVNEVELMY